MTISHEVRTVYFGSKKAIKEDNLSFYENSDASCGEYRNNHLFYYPISRLARDKKFLKALYEELENVSSS